MWKWESYTVTLLFVGTTLITFLKELVQVARKQCLLSRICSFDARNIKRFAYTEIWLLLLILYGCGTWSDTLREERGLRAFENGVLRKIFGLKRDEVTWNWTKLCNE